MWLFLVHLTPFICWIHDPMCVFLLSISPSCLSLAFVLNHFHFFHLSYSQSCWEYYANPQCYIFIHYYPLSKTLCAWSRNMEKVNHQYSPHLTTQFSLALMNLCTYSSSCYMPWWAAHAYAHVPKWYLKAEPRLAMETPGSVILEMTSLKLVLYQHRMRFLIYYTITTWHLPRRKKVKKKRTFSKTYHLLIYCIP